MGNPGTSPHEARRRPRTRRQVLTGTGLIALLAAALLIPAAASSSLPGDSYSASVSKSPGTQLTCTGGSFSATVTVSVIFGSDGLWAGGADTVVATWSHSGGGVINSTSFGSSGLASFSSLLPCPAEGDVVATSVSFQPMKGGSPVGESSSRGASWYRPASASA